jgi:hypothetical protein
MSLVTEQQYENLKPTEDKKIYILMSSDFKLNESCFRHRCFTFLILVIM